MFGIDRGNTHDGRDLDEDLRQYVEESEVNEDHFRADFYVRTTPSVPQRTAPRWTNLSAM